MGVIWWYVLARLSQVAYLNAQAWDGSPPRDAVKATAFYDLSDLAYEALRDG